jgi:hypothetical protein
MKSFNRNTKEYREWRIKILNRDKWECKICGSKTSLHVHHLTPISVNRKLALVISNGIVCCRHCHKQLRYKELAFVSMFKKMIENKPLNKTERTLLNMILKNKKIKVYKSIKGKTYGSKNRTKETKKAKKDKAYKNRTSA